jgi:antitoxin component YwqK of YwqJK toxin-antitoxin module
LLIVGCSKPVEDSTLINKVGLMYLPDSDSPYTGEVFTNYDTGEKEYQGTYENGLLVTYSYLNKDGSVKEPVNGETLIDRGGLLYEVNGQKLYTGDVFELYKDGSRKSTGSLKGGRYNGLRTDWYRNGQKMSEGTFKDGKEDGLKTRWFSDGKKHYERNYKDGLENGLETNWYGNGQKFYEVTFKDGKEDGLVTEWYENGEKKSEGTYKNGEFDGLSTSWYKNGQKMSEGAYKDGKDWWFENGQKHYERNYKDGLVTEWYENGQKMSEGTYKNGEFDGLSTSWYGNGQKMSEGTYKNGEFDGLWTNWDKDGSKYEGKDGSNYWEFNLVLEGKVKRKDDKDGTFLYWYDDMKTKIKFHKTYKNGKLDGLVTNWYENGQKETEGTYKDGKLISRKDWKYDGSVME